MAKDQLKIIHRDGYVSVRVGNSEEVWVQIASVQVGSISKVILDTECDWIETPQSIHVRSNRKREGEG